MTRRLFASALALLLGLGVNACGRNRPHTSPDGASAATAPALENAPNAELTPSDESYLDRLSADDPPAATVPATRDNYRSQIDALEKELDADQP